MIRERMVSKPIQKMELREMIGSSYSVLNVLLPVIKFNGPQVSLQPFLRS